eukprot:6130971-Prymnesium_polylepis.1
MQRGGHKPENYPLSTEFSSYRTKLESQTRRLASIRTGVLCALLVRDWTLPRSLSHTVQRLRPGTGDVRFDDARCNSLWALPDLQNVEVWRGRRSGAELAFLTRFFDLDSANTTVSRSVTHKCATNNFSAVREDRARA